MLTDYELKTSRFNSCFYKYRNTRKKRIKIFLRWQEFDLETVRILCDGNNNDSNKLTNRYYFNNNIRIGTLVALSS